MDINTQDKDENTPLHKASKKGFLKIAKFLVGQRAIINVKNNKGETPLDIAKKKSSKNKNLIELLENK